LLDNPAIRVREWYEPIARQWLQAQFRNLGEIRLMVDGTKVGFGHQLLIICLAYRKRAIPIAWTWVKHVRGHSTAAKQLALLAYVRKLLPKGAARRAVLGSVPWQRCHFHLQQNAGAYVPSNP
jgi:hypothetical protein